MSCSHSTGMVAGQHMVVAVEVAAGTRRGGTQPTSEVRLGLQADVQVDVVGVLAYLDQQEPASFGWVAARCTRRSAGAFRHQAAGATLAREQTVIVQPVVGVRVIAPSPPATLAPAAEVPGEGLQTQVQRVVVGYDRGRRAAATAI